MNNEALDTWPQLQMNSRGPAEQNQQLKKTIFTKKSHGSATFELHIAH